MARRASSVPNIAWLLAGLAMLLVLIGAGGYFFGSSNTPYRATPEFPVDEYLSTSTSLRGNTYRLSGAVLNSIAWSPSEGRLISVKPNNSDSPIPVVIPAGISEANIQKGQRFHFLVEVREGGVIYAADITKS
jgi:hypothetical protein